MAVVPAELAPGIWRWTSIQGAWDEGDFRRTSHHHAFAVGDDLVLVDPVQFSASQPALDALYARPADRGGALHVVMTDPTSKWHVGERICRAHGGTIWGSPDTAKLLDDPSLLRHLKPSEPGPGGVVAVDIGGSMWNERAIWVPSHGTLVFGSIFIRDPAGDPLRFQARADDPRVRTWFEAQIAPTFDPLLELPVGRIALRHGDGVTTDPAGALLEAVAAGI